MFNSAIIAYADDQVQDMGVMDVVVTRASPLRGRRLTHVRTGSRIFVLLFRIAFLMSDLMSLIRYYLYHVEPYLLFLPDYSR
jgi:hypothetical protein